MKSVKLFVALIAISLMCAEANAQFRGGIPFGKKTVQQSAQRTELTNGAGPWLIMCASFSGEDGRQQASRLARELRESYKLKAYTYSHKFDVAREVQGRGLGWEKYGEMGNEGHRARRMRPAGESSIEEVAVLVGDFATIEDAGAQRLLKQLKVLVPKSMGSYDVEAAVNDDSLAGNRLRAWRDFAGSASTDTNKNSKGAAQNGPLRAAFLMPNPMLPEEYFSARKLDDAVVKWNMKPEYSLLKNPGIYSVQVATFSGESIAEADQILQKQQENAYLKQKGKKRTESKLNEAAGRAHALAKTLRKQGIEAYEFHGRYESYVCVGAFDWLTREDANGRKESNPDMVTLIQKFKGKIVNANGRRAMTTYKLPDMLVKAKIACDVQPIPVLIPKATPTQMAQATKKRFGLFR